MKIIFIISLIFLISFVEGRKVEVLRHHDKQLQPSDVINNELDVADSQRNHEHHVTHKKRSDVTKKRSKKHKTSHISEKVAHRRAMESAWFYCSDGSEPREVADILSDVTSDDVTHRGVMCEREYPTQTCCGNYDQTHELTASKITESIPDAGCARMLLELRCAHCSPRSWWLFRAPDHVRRPHERTFPILCPDFCEKFYKKCKDFVPDLMIPDFCLENTTKEKGPCFPDYEIRKGTID